MEAPNKRQCLPQAEDDDVPPTLEEASRMQQQLLMRGLDELSRREGDLTLVLDGGVELRTSRVVLMASCAYFRRRLDCSWEGATPRLELGGVSAAVVETVLSFLASGSTVGLSRANAQEVLTYADFIGVAPLCGACRRVLDPDVERTRPSLADFASLTSGPTASVPPPQPLASEEAGPHGFALVLQMAQGTTLVLSFTERRPNDVRPRMVSLGDDSAEAWPHSGEFRWQLPESAEHETEVCHAAVWRQSDNAYCVFRDLGRWQRRGTSSDGFSDATWPVTAVYTALLRLHRTRAGEDESADGEEAEAELLSPVMFRLYRRQTNESWPEERAQPSPDLLLEMDTQLEGAQLAQLFSGHGLLEWDRVGPPEPQLLEEP